MKKLLTFAAFVSFIFLTGCASIAGTSPVQGAAESSLEKVTAADLDGAIAAAQAGGDIQAVACFTEVKNFTGNMPAHADVKGVFSAWEGARLLRRRIGDGVPEALHNACAPLLIDARITLLKLGVIAGAL